jgi:hypothetical protein
MDQLSQWLRSEMSKAHEKTYLIEIFLIAYFVRLSVCLFFYGGGDATNISSFIELHYNNFDIYSVRSPWPYFPLSNHILLFAAQVADIFNIDVHRAYRLYISIYDSLIATLIYSYTKSRYRNKSLGLAYALNPVSVIIISAHGFNDSAAIFFLLASFMVFGKNPRKRSEAQVAAIFFAASISIKPLALVFLPYMLYHLKSSETRIVILTFSLAFFTFNSYYLIGANYESLLRLSELIFSKIASGHQSSPIGLGALSGLLGETLVKGITVLGAFFFLLVYAVSLKLPPHRFAVIILSALFVLRYNLHPQYLTWLLAFAFYSNSHPRILLLIFLPLLLHVAFAVTNSTGAYVVPRISNLDFSISASLLSILDNEYIAFFTNITLIIILSLTIPMSIYRRIIRQMHATVTQIRRKIRLIGPFSKAILVLSLLVISVQISFSSFTLIHQVKLLTALCVQTVVFLVLFGAVIPRALFLINNILNTCTVLFAVNYSESASSAAALILTVILFGFIPILFKYRPAIRLLTDYRLTARIAVHGAPKST